MLGARHMPCLFRSGRLRAPRYGGPGFHPEKEAVMMWAFLAVIAAMGLALVKVRRQRKLRESRGSQAAA